MSNTSASRQWRRAGGGFRRASASRARARCSIGWAQAFTDHALLGWARSNTGSSDANGTRWRPARALDRAGVSMKAADFIQRGIAKGPALARRWPPPRRPGSRRGFQSDQRPGQDRERLVQPLKQKPRTLPGFLFRKGDDRLSGSGPLRSKRKLIPPFTMFMSPCCRATEWYPLKPARPNRMSPNSKWYRSRSRCSHTEEGRPISSEAIFGASANRPADRVVLLSVVVTITPALVTTELPSACAQAAPPFA